MAVSYSPNSFPNRPPSRWSRTVSAISRSYIATEFSAEKYSARFNSNVLGGGSSRVSRIASARASTSPIGTRRPIRPPSRISAGPEGQSVLTQGQPQASASIKTPGKPSIREDVTNRDARAHEGVGVVHPSRHRNPVLQIQPANEGGQVFPLATVAEQDQPGGGHHRQLLEGPDQGWEVLDPYEPAGGKDDGWTATGQPGVGRDLSAQYRQPRSHDRVVDRGYPFLGKAGLGGHAVTDPFGNCDNVIAVRHKDAIPDPVSQTPIFEHVMDHRNHGRK